MRFWKYRILLGEDLIGEIVIPTDSSRQAAEAFLEKMTGYIGAGLRRVLKDEPGLLVAERVEE